MKIPENIIRSFIEKEFPDWKPTQTGQMRINPPNSPERSFKLYVDPKKGVWYDQKNQVGNTFFSFLQEFYGINKNDAIFFLVKNFSDIMDFDEKVEYKDLIKKQIEIPEGLKFFAEKKEGIFYNVAKKYVDERKIKIDELGYIIKSGSPYNERIFIPFYEDGELVYFITRTWDKNNKMRYLNPIAERKSIVYNIDNIMDEVFIFEGVFCALSLEEQIGTAILSAMISKEQCIKIWDRAPKVVVFVPDNDETGERTLQKNIETFLYYKPTSLKTKIYVYRIPKPYKDFNEMKMATGKGRIDINECEEYRKFSVGASFFDNW